MSHKTVYHLSSLLRKCASLSIISLAKQTHSQILVHGFLPHMTLETDLLLAYCRSGFLKDARKVFDKMTNRNMHSWNILLVSYVNHSLYADAINVFDMFLKMGSEPDHYTLPPVVKACAAVGDLNTGKVLHSWVIRLGFEDYVVVGSSVLDFYMKIGELEDAKRVFFGMSWKDSVFWNTLISGIERAGFYGEALRFFKIMNKEVKLDSMTIPSVLSACSGKGELMKGKEIHGQVIKNDKFYGDVAIRNALIDMYAKCGCLRYSEKVFWNTPKLNLVTWTTMISCYGVHGKGEESLALFRKMKNHGFEPNSITLTAILASCSHSGYMDQGQRIFNSISSVYGCVPTVEHYACMVDILGRFGYLIEALALVMRMEIDVTASVWGALLAGCLMHKNVEIGEIAAYHLFYLEPRNSSNYIALCSIYESLGLTDGVSKIRAKMRELGLAKTPGCSWITVAGKTHGFYQGDYSHPQSEMIYTTLYEIFKTMSPDSFMRLSLVKDKQNLIINALMF